MTDNIQEKQLDHTTARVVAELASALLPHLKETVSSELALATAAMPINVSREVEEALTSLRRIQAFSESLAAALDSAQNSASRLSDGLKPLTQASEAINDAAARIERLAAKQPDEGNNAQITKELLRALEENLRDWGGILKANGNAHTKELNEFSAEVSEQVSWMKSSLPEKLKDAFLPAEKALLSRAEDSRAITESVKALDARLTRLEKTGKIVLVEGIVLIMVLAAAVVLYFR